MGARNQAREDRTRWTTRVAISKAAATEATLSAPAKGKAWSGDSAADPRAASTASRRTKAMTPPTANRNSLAASGFPCHFCKQPERGRRRERVSVGGGGVPHGDPERCTVGASHRIHRGDVPSWSPVMWRWPLRPEANARGRLPPPLLCLTCLAPSVDVRCRPLASAVIVTHLVTQSLAHARTTRALPISVIAGTGCCTWLLLRHEAQCCIARAAGRDERRYLWI